MIKIAIIGEENVGKSSLLNALVGEKTSIVTNLAGTTRGQIRGFAGDFEIIDTPGMHKNASLLGKQMRKSISAAVVCADVILYVLDAQRFTAADVQKVENYRAKQTPVIVAVNKTDNVTMAMVYPKLATLNKLDFVRAIVPLSAKTGFNLDVLRAEIDKIRVEIGKKTVDSGVKSGVKPVGCGAENDTENPDPDTFTDQSVRDMSAEIIREAVIVNTRAEIPHGVAVVVTKFTETTKCIEICADIMCEKPTHKPIIIGAGGANLKKIGIAARTGIEKLTGAHVKLYTTVVVKPNWKNDADVVARG
jgi:GTP-binding protein Era